MARPNNKVRDPEALSNLKHDSKGELTFSSQELYDYEVDRAAGRLSKHQELRAIARCLEQGGLTKKERNRLVYRTRKITNNLPTPRQTKVWLTIRKMEASLNRAEKELKEEGLL